VDPTGSTDVNLSGKNLPIHQTNWGIRLLSRFSENKGQKKTTLSGGRSFRTQSF
jgi:hypothetical protein